MLANISAHLPRNNRRKSMPINKTAEISRHTFTMFRERRFWGFSENKEGHQS